MTAARLAFEAAWCCLCGDELRPAGDDWTHITRTDCTRCGLPWTCTECATPTPPGQLCCTTCTPTLRTLAKSRIADDHCDPINPVRKDRP